MKPMMFWAAAATLSAALCASASAHDYRVGDLVIDHPYALPSLEGSANGVMHIRTLKNTGSQPDRLLGASTPVASSVEIHHMEQDANNVMRMRAVPELALPAGGEVSLKHGGAWHVMLLGLKQPLKAGERFSLTLKFAKAGEKEIRVWVLEPRDGSAAHMH